jgi:dUTP pyrophosphatase
LPQRATAGAAGLDLFACLERPDFVVIGRDPALVPTGIAIEVPPGCEGQIRPRSGLGARGISVVFGTIDSDYRGEILVTMYFIGALGSYTVRHDDRIAQLVLAGVEDFPVLEVEDLSSTERGSGRHGSTGV